MLINDSHVALIESLINCKKSNSYVYLPNDVIAIKSYNELTVKKIPMIYMNMKLSLINMLDYQMVI